MSADAERLESDWERRRRLARIFGDVLPESTTDDLDAQEAARTASGRSASDPGDDWLRAQVPPHHGS